MIWSLGSIRYQPGCRGTLGCPEKGLGVLPISELDVKYIVVGLPPDCLKLRKGAVNKNKLRNTILAGPFVLGIVMPS